MHPAKGYYDDEGLLNRWGRVPDELPIVWIQFVTNPLKLLEVLQQRVLCPSFPELLVEQQIKKKHWRYRERT